MAHSLGVVIVTKRSNKKPSGFVYKVVLMCDRGGEYKIKDSSKVSGTKKSNCRFELEGIYSNEYDSWTLRVICDEHNHQPVQYIEGHPYAKRLTEDEYSLVAELTRMNVALHDILSILKERNVNNVSTIKTIYNARNKIRMLEQIDKSPMQVLMSLLHSNGYIYEFSTTNSNELENLFFVHPTSFDIWRAFLHVLIIDATYKTNKYNMPFVQIVGVTSTNKTFCIAFVFMHNEREVNYNWALNCLKLTLDKCMYPRVIVTDRELALMNACKKVFPNAAQLLCRWHINQNIFKNCKRSISSSNDWDSFLSLWELLEDSATLLSYTKNYMQLQSLLIKYPTLEIILGEVKRSKDLQLDSSNCGCRIRNSCGLPCACELLVYISSGQYIQLDSIDVFWRKLDISPSTFEPNDDISCDGELEHFKENFNKQSKVEKKSLLRKLKDIIRSTTDIQEPRVQKNTRGRPTLKKPQQKRHVDPIPQDSRRYSCSTRSNFVGLDSIKEPARHSSYETDLNKKPMIDLNEVPHELESSYFNFQTPYLQPDIMDDIPYIFHPYITNIQNVDGDGNCGFRAIAVGLGRVQTDYNYIRQQMIDELQSGYHIYEKMFVVDINTLYESLCFFGSPAPTRYWMTMPEAGVLVSNKFGVIVHCLNTQCSTTIFPFWRGPEEFQQHQAITVALVYNHSHYVMVHLQGEYPMPFVTTYWNYHKNSSAARWETMYRSRIELFSQLIHREKSFEDLSD